MLFKGKHVLVTGGAGFIGSNVAIRLANEGAEVTVVDSMLPDYGGNLFNLNSVSDRIHINFSDMRDWHSLVYIVRGKDFIFNLAGQVSHQDSIKDPLMDMDINVKAQLSFLEACRLFNRSAIIVYASTRQFYGKPKYLPVDEDHPLNPPDVNGINKLAAEQYHTLYSRIHNLTTVSLRLTNTYGPRQMIKNSRQGFIGWFINRAIKGETIELFCGGKQVRDLNFVDDVVEAMLLAAITKKCHGNVYNLSGERASLKQIAETLLKISGKGSMKSVEFPEEREKIDIGDFYGTSEKFQKDSGWYTKIKLLDGLSQTIEYYNKYKDHYLE